MMKIINTDKIEILNTDKFKTVDIQIMFTDKTDYNDIACYNLLFRMLSSRNKKYKSESKFSEFKDNNYGLSIYGNYTVVGDVSTFSLASNCINKEFSMSNDLLDIQINTLKDCLYHPYLTNKALKQVKRKYISLLESLYDNKNWVLANNINAYFGYDNPYGANPISLVEDIKKVTIKDIKRVYNKLFTQNCKVYVSGKVDENEIIEKLTLPNTITKRVDIGLDYLKELKEDKIIYSSNFLQSRVELMYELNIDYNDLELIPVSTFFCSMLNEEMFNVIREENNYCYLIGCYYSPYLHMVRLTTEIDSKNLDNVINGVNELIDNFNTKDLTNRFNVVKTELLDGVNEIKDHKKQLMNFMINNDLIHKDETIEDYRNRINKVTLAQVKELAKKVKLKIVAILKEKENED